ncbi:hypothetical protein KR51_00031860 [Rubidibacter lacunae KORDI 51-2]|uniref:DUF433 domain-containing protein n=1 Tax=Rubidibacter lacunae KORDI 51-2 TaxID=582515 RepID=U5DKK4_9CHRO|nr:DUF433 domain-containing protein [Rubidibacter lacunae]ERN40245.1 hypothetical protein KR51_00031860 [Rubidibacter lacunae KORDI 51-2]
MVTAKAKGFESRAYPDYANWRAGLTEDPSIMGGEPVFPNSRLTAYHIGSMLDRSPDAATEAEILEDYPFLSEQDLRFAQVYARSNPRA